MDQTDLNRSKSLLITIRPENIAMFRFILEAHGHLAYFTVLERQTAVLKLAYTRDRESAVFACLEEIAATVPFTQKPWPKFASIIQ
ncbi:MAG: DUF4911 domain-containing protein [Desulfovibrionaceae bacterium]|nr:DUF4911 domain-containing protein [Desulfovibrionaceae bacterium]